MGTMPDMTEMPFAHVIEEVGRAEVWFQISINNGLTWTSDHVAPVVPDMTMRPNQPQRSREHVIHPNGKLHELHNTIRSERDKARFVEAVNPAVITICNFPSQGEARAEPACAPVTGGADILLRVDLPWGMPTKDIVVKLVCQPLHDIDDPDLKEKAPLRCDAAKSHNADPER